jgi:rhodanese-related sulfurtransferase
MIGYIAENRRTGASDSVQWHELPALRAGGASVIDVRTQAEFAAGHIPGAVNIPIDELRDRMSEIPDGDLIVSCQVGQRGHTATMLLAGLGRKVANLDGGYLTWLASQRTTTDTSAS